MNRSDQLTKKATHALHGIRKALFGMPLWRLCLLIFVIALLQNAAWTTPLMRYNLKMAEDISRSPFSHDTAAQWQLYSFLGPVFGHFTSTSGSATAYGLLHFVLLALILPALVWVIDKKYGDFAARCTLLLFLLSPLSNVLLTWLGSPDVITTLLSMAIVIFWSNSPVIFAAALLLGINHAEQGLVMLALLTTLRWFASGSNSALRFGGVAIAGLLLGRGLLEWYFYVQQFEIVFSRLDYFGWIGSWKYVNATLSNPFALLFSLYHVLLLFVLAYVAYFWSTAGIARGFLVYSVAALLIIVLTLDQTRVYAILTFPGLLLLIFAPGFRVLRPKERDFFADVLTACFVAGLLVPRFVVWEGNVYFSAYANLLEQLHVLLGG